MAYRLIIKFPFQSINDEQYTLVLWMQRDGAYYNATTAMDADPRCFKRLLGYTDGTDSVQVYEGTLTGSVKANDDNREDMFAPLCPSKLKFNMACQQFPAWLMDACGYATDVKVVLYTDTGGVSNHLRVRWRGYLQCNTLNMTVVDDLLACPLVAVDEVGIAKYMPFRANCSGRPAHLTLYQLFKKWWQMHWYHFERVYDDLHIPTNQAALYWQRNAAIIDDQGDEESDLLNTLVANLERYYLDRDATWQTVLEDVCQYLGVHFAIGGYAANYSFDNYILASYDQGSFTTYTYGLHTDNVSSQATVHHSTLGNQRKVGADLQVTYEPDKWKGAKVTSEPERPPVHKYLEHDNVQPITPAAGHGEFAQARMGNIDDGGYSSNLAYWRLQYTQIVNAQDQWTEEADYIEMEDCHVSTAGRSVGGQGYFPMNDSALGHDRPNGSDTDSIEFITQKIGLIPVRLGKIEHIDAEWPKKMTDYLYFLHNLWGRRYWSNDDPVNTDASEPFKVATIKPFGLDASVMSSAKAFLKIDLRALILNENIGTSEAIFQWISNGVTYTNLIGQTGTVFPMTDTHHDYDGQDDHITGRLADDGSHYRVYSTYPYLTVRLSIGNWFYYFSLENNQSYWQYYADPSQAPTFRMPLIGNIEQKWIVGSGISANVVKNYYFSELRPKSGLFDSAFLVPLEGVATPANPLDGEVKLELWWPTEHLNAYVNGERVYKNNILGMLINDIEISYTDDAEISGDDIKVDARVETDPDSDTKELKELSLALSTPKVAGVFNNCLLYDGGKAWHNLQAIRWQGANSGFTPEEYLAGMIAKVYNAPQVWVELKREFAAATYGNIANMDFRVQGLTEAAGVFVPVERAFDFTKGWVRWKLQRLDDGSVV